MKRYSLKTFAFSIATAFATQLSMAQYPPDQVQSEPGSIASAAEPTKHIRASDLLGVNVTSKEGENLGQLQDLIFNPHTGKIQFALVGKGFMAGLGDKLIPVPWQAADLRSHKEFVLHVDRQKMQVAPAWNAADFDQPDYILRIYKFYEFEPQGDMGGVGRSGHESGQGRGSSSVDDESSSSSSTQDGEPRDEAAPEPDN